MTNKKCKDIRRDELKIQNRRRPDGRAGVPTKMLTMMTVSECAQFLKRTQQPPL